MNVNVANALPDRAALPDGPAERPPLVVFAAERWSFDWQRPQQLLTRLAKHYRVYYLEEPHTTHADPWLECREVADGVEVLVAHTRCDAPGFHDDQLPVVGGLLAQFMRERAIVEPLAWLDTPAPLPLAEALSPRGVIYDCHDDRAAAADDDILRHREARLMELADVVIAGGPSLYQSHRGRHANVHCIANAVDAAHFAPPLPAARSIEAVSARAIHAAIPNPRLGFFGVIDERVDLDLIAAVADARTDWHLVMVGPVVKIDPATLPQLPNVHWLGQQSYDLLPQLVAGWDVCLMPFALNEATRFISPTKTLEYMAAGRPVVSTAVHDVIALYGDVVRVALDTERFVRACDEALAEPQEARAVREERMAARVARYSWDATARTILEALDEVLEEPVEPEREPLPAAAGIGHRVA